jgi:hypothetical protein
MAHDEFSPSRRVRFKHCAGSIREESKYPEGPSGPAAVDGTHTHTFLEHCVKAHLANPLDFIGLEMVDHEGEFVVDAERANRVAVAINYLRQRTTPNMKVESEIRVDPEFLIGRKGASGTVDVLIYDPYAKEIEIIDYKDGIQPTDAREQLEQYAVGVLAGFKVPHNLFTAYHTVHLTVIQPKLVWKNLEPITTVTFPVKYFLDDVVGSLAAELANASAPDAPLTPGEKQCKYCRAKGGCTAYAQFVMKEVNVMFAPVETPTPLDLVQQSADKNPATMDSAQLRQILEAAPLLRQLIEAVEEEAMRRLQAGQKVEGLKLVHGRGSRVWAHNEEEMAEKLVAMGIPKGAIYETKLVSPAKAEKLTWEKRDGSKNQLSKKQLERLNEYITKMAGKLTVVPESDSRPAVVTDASSMFGAVNNEPDLPAWLK